MVTIPGPGDLLRLAGRGKDEVGQLLGLVPRLVGIVTEVERLLARVDEAVGAIERIEGRASGAVSDVEAIVARVDPLLARFEPLLDQLEPMVSRIAATTDPGEVEAVVKLVNHLPELVEKIDADIFPMLDTLNSVAPDLRDLLITSKELNEIIASIPGLGRRRRHAEQEQHGA